MVLDPPQPEGAQTHISPPPTECPNPQARDKASFSPHPSLLKNSLGKRETKEKEA